VSSEEKSNLHRAISELQRAVDAMSTELALLRNALYQPARPEDYGTAREPATK
jgi:hypothetical protein